MDNTFNFLPVIDMDMVKGFLRLTFNGVGYGGIPVSFINGTIICNLSSITNVFNIIFLF